MLSPVHRNHSLYGTQSTWGEIGMGRLGSVTLNDSMDGAMADPFVYDASNIDEFKDIF